MTARSRSKSGVVGVDRSSEHAVHRVVQHRAAMRARDHHQRAVLFVHVLKHQPEGEQVVVGVRIERPVLVPLDGAAAAGTLGVQLGGEQRRVRAEKIAENLGHRGAAQHVPEIGILLVRDLDAGQARLVRPVALVEVVDVIALGHAARRLDQIPGDLLQPRQLRRGDRVLHQQVAVFGVEALLRVGQHVRILPLSVSSPLRPPCRCR